MNNSQSVEYEERKKEVDFFFFTLEKLYKFDDDTQYNNVKDELNYNNYNFSDFLRLQKTSSYLILYNLIEATVRSFAQLIYEKISEQNLTYDCAIEEIQKLWFSLEYKKLKANQTNYDQHRNKAKELVGAIVKNEIIINLSQYNVYFGGNIDCVKIIEFLKSIGIYKTLKTSSSSAFTLSSIKEKRNKVAHGGESFLKAGRDLTIDDLKKYHIDVVSLLDELKNEVSNYLQNKSYLGKQLS